MLFKFLLILGLILYVVYKIGTFFFKAGAASQLLRDQQRKGFQQSPPPQAKGKSANNVKGGEYVDYEEIK